MISKEIVEQVISIASSVEPVTLHLTGVPILSQVNEKSVHLSVLAIGSKNEVGRNRLSYKRSGRGGSRSRRNCAECSKGTLNHRCNTTFLKVA